jgi:hypothetical protein
MYEDIVDSQQLEINDQAMKIRKKDIQILRINQKLIEVAAESKSAMEKRNSEIISLKNMLNRQQSEILKQRVSKKVEISQNGSTLKGQLISKCPFGVFKSTKKPTNLFSGFLP